MTNNLVISPDPQTGMLVALLPGVLEPWRIDPIDLAADFDAAAYRKQIAPIIAEFKAQDARLPSTRGQIKTSGTCVDK